VGKNQHRWKGEFFGSTRGLEKAAEQLAWAWKHDKKQPNSYPTRTYFSLCDIKEQLQGRLPSRAGVKLPPPPPPPQRLSDLLREETVKALYEEQNEGSYEEALKEAASGKYDNGYKAWKRILRSVDAAYWVLFYGLEHGPKPKVNFLHRELLEIAKLAGRGDLNLEGIVEFLDDICPCGKGHRQDAIRKLRVRQTARQKTFTKES